MQIKAVLFDLDATLLPMDQEIFLSEYFRQLAAHMAQYGYEPKRLLRSVRAGTEAMLKNDGRMTNEARFWETFAALYKDERDVRRDEPCFDAFYRENFASLRAFCRPTRAASETVSMLRSAGIRVVLATNPVFPAVATEHRVLWAGLKWEDFEMITTYENTCHAKPNPEYYREIADKLGLLPAQCLMVGNDVGDDMPARKIGMEVFLLTDCLIGGDGADLSLYPGGGFDALKAYLGDKINLVT